jgi:hypothetical protein
MNLVPPATRIGLVMMVLTQACSVKATNTADIPGADAGVTPGSPKVSSGFAIDDDGWTISGDAQATSVKPDYLGTGGNPDGLISAKDDVAGGTWYFVAPGKYLGDQASAYGQDLKFDLKVDKVPASPFDAPDVILKAGAVVLVFDTDNNPSTDWTSYTVPLDEGGWHSDDLDGSEPTRDQMKSVLGALTAIWIRGEFNTGADTGALDNVRFGEAH